MIFKKKFSGKNLAGRIGYKIRGFTQSRDQARHILMVYAQGPVKESYPVAFGDGIPNRTFANKARDIFWEWKIAQDTSSVATPFLTPHFMAKSDFQTV